MNHNPPHITIALLGRFKGEIGESYHLLPIVPITWSGIDNKKWVGRLVNFYRSQNITTGLFFHNATGHRIRAGDIEQIFFGCLEQVQSLRSDLISSSEEVEEEYGIYRSFRRDSTSEATNQGLPPDIINTNNRSIVTLGNHCRPHRMKSAYSVCTSPLTILIRTRHTPRGECIPSMH